MSRDLKAVNTAWATRIALSLVGVGVILFGSLITGSCSKQSDSARPEASEKMKEAKEIDDHRRTDNRQSGEDEGATANSAGGDESESKPSADDIVDDCFAFAWLTKATPVRGTTADCPQCPSAEEATHVIKFEGAKVERVSCNQDTCEVTVSIRGSFNPSRGGTISGGLTGWIPPEQREQYSRGQTPPGENVYHVKITYRREEAGWRPVDFG